VQARPPPPDQGRLTGRILAHLPDAEHDWVRRKLRAAWALTDADQAKRDLEALARALARKHPGAAGALREGLDETLTVTRLGITGQGWDLPVLAQGASVHAQVL
jgi:hypothetical protein